MILDINIKKNNIFTTILFIYNISINIDNIIKSSYRFFKKETT